MKSGRMLAVAILGIAILGYVVYRLTADSGREVKHRDAYAQSDGEARDSRRQRVPTQRLGGDDDEPVAGERKEKRIINNPANLQPPPPPQPPMSKEDARAGWAAYEAELKEVRKRVTETKEPLPNEEWVDLYKRGNDALNPLQMALDSADPGEAQEVNDAHATFRELIMSMEPGRPVE